MRLIASDTHKGRTIRVLGDTVKEQFLGGQSASYEQTYVTIDGNDVTDQTVFIGTSDPSDMIGNAKALIDGGLY